MKKILFLFSFLFSITAFGQIPALNNLVGSNPPNSALIKRALDGSKSFTASGTDTYTVATGLGAWSGVATYADGDILTLLITNANTSTTVTLNADSEGAAAVKDQAGNDLAIGDLKSGGTYIFRHNGTHWRVLNVASGGIASVDWGDIGGTLSNQTDVQTAIDAKVAASITNGVTTSAPNQDQVFDALALKRNVGSTASTGTAVQFDQIRDYGISTSAETGNITLNTTGAQTMITVVMRHNNATEPSYGSEFKRMEGSRGYVVGVDNYFYFTYLSSTKVQYTINQEE